MDAKRLLLLACLAPFCAVAETSVPGWQFTNLSKALPDQPTFPATRFDGCPSAALGGVAWRAYNQESGRELAFWNRKSVDYVSLTKPPPPGWEWGISADAASAWGHALAFSMSGGRIPCIWMPSGMSCPWYEIFYRDDEGLRRITHDEVSCNKAASLYENAIAWQRCPVDSADLTDWEICYWDGNEVRFITDNDVSDSEPSLYDNTIAWCSDGMIVYASVPPDSGHGSLPTPIIVGPGERPSLFKQQIAYQASDGNDMEIFLHDIASGETIQFTENECADVNPSLFDGTMAWARCHDDPWGHFCDDSDIFYWDGVTVQQLTDDPLYDNNTPSLWGTGLNTTIAYQKALHATFGYGHVMCARRTLVSVAAEADGKGIRLTWPSLEGRTYRPECSHDLVIWKVVASGVPSAGYGTTSWTDETVAGSSSSASPNRQRFYRVAKNE